jgi:uncharacterized membrane protein (UPF0127 family)
MSWPALVIALLAGGATAGAATAGCAPGRVELRGGFGSAGFTVELADDPAERALGLMNRPFMPAGAGMIFIYERAQPVAFWMENTLIPLDMIFVDAAGRVMKVHENAVPRDRTAIPGEGDVLAVLEINGGLARAIGIVPGSELRHEAMPQETAAWPCAD